jgi:glycosyltransferase involved in cell wall biosynthesis
MGELDQHANRLLSIVVIGLNEELHLYDCLDAVLRYKPNGYDLEVFYVDSGSTDASVKIAGMFPQVRLLQLSSSQPSAAQGRNMGLKHSRGSFVQLIDGDSVIQPGWMDSAIAILERTTDIACVFGQCIEMYPQQSIYMRASALDWYIPPGDYRLCGGNAMWRTSVITAHGFFDESLQLGEEPDLCYRVRQGGGRVVCIDAPMVKHDLAIQRFGQYWRRAENSGKGYAHIALRYWRQPEKLWLREMLVNFCEPLIWVLLVIFGCWLGGLLCGLALLMAWCLVRALRIGYSVRRRTANFREGLLYGLHCQFVRLPAALGQVKLLLRSK